MSVHIAQFRPDDRPSWEVLARGYKDFYNTPTADAEYSKAWDRLIERDGVHGLGAYVDEKMVGFAHYLFHTSTWAPTACYLQDLFTSPTARGQGVARALIEAVASEALQSGAVRYYWLTQENNAMARVLYNKVAKYGGFIRYDYAL
jgi:GNAT superfamily N-acetyltransferase